jgi:hypothetical protein
MIEYKLLGYNKEFYLKLIRMVFQRKNGCLKIFL